MARKDELGVWGETVAADFLRTEGYEILERGWRCSVGEIDIVARRESTVVVVEVKTRRSVRFGHPLESITATKYSRLRSLAGEWCRTHDVRPPTLRIDGIGIVGDGLTVHSLDHREGVFA